MCVHIMGPYEACAWQLSYLLLAITSSSAVAQAPSYGPRRAYFQIHNRLNWANTSLSAAYAHGHHGPIQANWQNTHMAIIWAHVRHMFGSCRHLLWAITS